MKTRLRLPSGYTIFTAGALAAAIALTACGPDDGVASGAVQAAGTPPVVAQPGPTVGTAAAPVYAPVPPTVVAAAPTAPAPAGTLTAVPPGYVLVPASSLVQQPAAAPAPQAVAPEAAPPAVKPARVSRTAAQADAAPRERRVASATLGRVRAVEPIRTRPEGSGVGGVVGGVLGGLVGNQFGGGNGRIATTALGAVGGAVAGNNVERNQRAGITGYRVVVEFDNGDSRTYEESASGEFRVGDRVSVRNGQLRRS